MKNPLKFDWLNFIRRLRTFFRAVLGDVQYAPPTWMVRAKVRLDRTRLGRWLAWAQAKPGRAAGAAVGAGALIVLGILGAQWVQRYLDSRPKPDYVEVKITAPSEPDLETGKPDKLLVRFSKSAATLKDLDKPVLTNVSLTPAIRGQWRWSSDRELEFTPEGKDEASRWQIGRTYTVEISKNLVPKHVLLRETSWEFTTPQLKGRVAKREFYQDPRDPKIKRVVVNLTYNYALDPEDFKKRVTMNLQTKDASVFGEKSANVAFAASFGKWMNEAYLVSDPLAIPKQDSVMKINVEKGARGAKGGATADATEVKVEVPGMYEYFRFEAATVTFARNERFEPEQVFILNTRAEIASEEVAKRVKFSLLPQMHPDHPKRKRWRWSSASEVTPTIRAKLEPVKFTLVPSPEEHSKSHAFKIDVPVNRFVLVEVPKGLVSYGGYELANDYVAVAQAPDYPKELMIMSQGSILTLSGDKKIPLLGRNIHDVKFRLARILPSQLNQFVYHTLSAGGDFTQPSFGVINDDSLAEIFEKKMPIAFKSPAATEYFSFDLEPYLNRDAGGKRGLFYVRVQEPKSGKSDQRLILLTDLGVVVKESIGRAHDVFVQNLRSGQPVAGASVEVLGANGLTVLTQTTNAEGRASFPDLRSFKYEKRPIAFVVRRDGDLSFLPYQMESRRLNFSQFDVGGLHDGPSSDDLSAFAFSDRGIYRPGDAVHLGLMVRARNWKKTFKDVPITWSVVDARGTEIHREKQRVDSGGLLSLGFATHDYSPTGTYDVRFFITKKDDSEEQIGSVTVRVEEFLPDRMRIAAKLSKDRLDGWVGPEDLKGEVSLMSLFGAPAEKRRVTARMTLTPVRPSFRAFKDYRFAPLRGDEKSFEETLEATQTDEKGHAEFTLNLARFATGFWSLRLDVEGFEAGSGRGVSASAGGFVSALPYLIGIKSVDDLAYLKKASEHQIDLVALNSELKKVAAKDLKLVLVERKYISALMQQTDGTYKYQSVLKEIPAAPQAYAIAEAGAHYRIPTENPGDFALVFRDQNDLELNRVAFSVAGDANLSRSLEKNAELQLVLAKHDFNPGEEIEMQIKAPYTGAGLITIERDKVYASHWFKTTTTAAIEKIRIPEGLEGNAYVNVTFLRAPDSNEIFMSPLSYAVQPFSVSLDEHKIALKLDTPAIVKPGEKLHVKYSASRKTKLVLYGVDEGILQVAQYKLPDPLTFFFQRRALQVKTFQLLDLLMPEYSVIQSLSSPGGDGSGGLLGRNLNPFKRKTDQPVVFWSGVIEAGPEMKTFDYDVPDYFNGNIKVMAVASAGASFGSKDQGVVARGDFVISSTVPLFVAPDDEFEVGLGVSNQAEGTGSGAQVKVDIDANADAFDLVGEKTRTIGIPEGREGQLSFRVKAKSHLGSAPIRFHASSGTKSARASTEASVRPALAYMSDLVGGFAPKPSFEVAVSRKLLPEFRKQTAAISPVPLVLGQGLKQFLDGYPYGCTEQTTSKTFPYVVLKSRPEFGIDTEKANAMLAGTLGLLRSRQSSSGAFAMYEQNPDHLGVTLYATHMLIEAKERGFNVPAEVLSRVLEFVGSTKVRDVSSLAHARDFGYALYLLARSGKVPGADVGFLRQALEKNFAKTWRGDLVAGYLAATYRLLKQDAEGQAIFKSLRLGAGERSEDYENFYDGFVRDTALLYLAAKHFPEGLKNFADDESLRAAFAPLVNRQYNTHSAAWSILALDALAAQAGSAASLAQMKIEEVDAGGTARALNLAAVAAPVTDFSATAEKIRFGVPKEQPFYYMMIQSGFDRDLPTKEIKKGLELTREFLDAKDQPIQKAKVGETVQIRLRVRALDKEHVGNVVIADLLPGGFEPVLEKFVPAGSTAPEHPEIVPSDNPDSDDGPLDEPPPPPDEPEGERGAFYRWLVPSAYAEAVESAIAALSPQYVDRREDRMVIYAEANREAQEFIYRAKVVSQGKFVVPPPFAESMYDRNVQYRGLPSTFTIEAP